MLRAAVLAVTMAGVCTSFGQTTFYVDDDAPLGGDGLSWASAFHDLQLALDAMSSGDTVRLAGGLFVPTAQVDPNDPNDPRAVTFTLQPGVTWLGGYAGLSGSGDPNERDVQQFETVLSGDLLGDDLPDFGHRYDNAYHVITGADIDIWAVIDGATVTAGHAEDFAGLAGGSAVLLTDSIVMLNNCTFVDNSCSAPLRAGHSRGPVYVDGGAPVIDHCRFYENRITARYADGGGLYLTNCEPTVRNCVFAGNVATAGGGLDLDGTLHARVSDCLFCANRAGWGAGITNGGSGYTGPDGPVIADCVFVGNEATVRGGAVYFNDNASSTHAYVLRCVFCGNASASGGALYVDGGLYDHPGFPNALLQVHNSAFVGNAADYGGAAYCSQGVATFSSCIFRACDAQQGLTLTCDSYLSSYISDVNFLNCIMRNGVDEIWNQDGSTVSISYSAITPAWPGEGNIDADPQLAFELAGSWIDSVTYDASTRCVTYYAGMGTFTPGALVGAFLNPDVTQPREFLIVSNDENTVTTYADYTLYAGELVGGDSGLSYRIRDYRLPAGSPCIDAGDNAAVASDIFDLDGDRRCHVRRHQSVC